MIIFILFSVHLIWNHCNLAVQNWTLIIVLKEKVFLQVLLWWSRLWAFLCWILVWLTCCKLALIELGIFVLWVIFNSAKLLLKWNFLFDFISWAFFISFHVYVISFFGLFGEYSFTEIEIESVDVVEFCINFNFWCQQLLQLFLDVNKIRKILFAILLCSYEACFEASWGLT